MCMIDDGDGRVTHLGAKYVLALKDHKCQECHRVIQASERYYREKYVFDGGFTCHKTCSHCMVVRNWLSDECGGWVYGGVEEDAREHCFSGGYRMDLYRAVIGMANLWRTPSGKILPVPNPITTSDDIRAAIVKATGEKE